MTGPDFLFGPQRQRLHDFLPRTRTIHLLLSTIAQSLSCGVTSPFLLSVISLIEEAAASETPACPPRRFDERAFFTWARFFLYSTSPPKKHSLLSDPIYTSTSTSTSIRGTSSEALPLRPLHSLHAPSPVLAPTTSPPRTFHRFSATPPQSPAQHAFFDGPRCK